MKFVMHVITKYKQQLGKLLFVFAASRNTIIMRLFETDALVYENAWKYFMLFQTDYILHKVKQGNSGHSLTSTSLLEHSAKSTQ